MSYLDGLKRPFFILAPMYDVTDTVFRQIVGECAAPDLYFTEFVNADGLQSAGRDKINYRLRYSDEERPIVAQIWGKNPDNYRQTAADLVEMGYDGVDINFGCPDKAVVKNGCCIAFINDRLAAAAVVQAVKEGVDGRVPVSVKTRLGFNEIDFSWPEFLLQQKIDMLVIHGRTKREMSKVPAHWDAIEKVRQIRDDLGVETLIVGNGDVMNREEGLGLAQKHNLDGIMIGRGIFHDPFAFAKSSPWSEFSPLQRLELYDKHVKLFTEAWQNNERPIVTLNKFCKIYINGFEGAKEWREQLMQAKNGDELLKTLTEIKPKLAQSHLI